LARYGLFTRHTREDGPRKGVNTNIVRTRFNPEIEAWDEEEISRRGGGEVQERDG